MSRRWPAVALAAAAVGGGIVALRRPAQRIHLPDGAPLPDFSGAPGNGTPAAARGAQLGGPARLAPPRWEPGWLSALGRWEPAAPSTVPGRVAAFVWAAPLSAVGLVVAAAAGAAPRRHGGLLVCSRARGPAGAVMRRRGLSAVALGQVVVAPGELSPALLAHERVHVGQAERLGGFLLPLAAALAAVYGPARHPLERAARRAERRALGAPG